MASRYCLFVLMFFLGCESNHSFQGKYVEVDSLANLFINEASNRGVTLSASADGLRFEFTRMNGGQSGSCKPTSYPKIISIDSITWKSINFAQKESLVFHEMAHCLLMRRHKNDAFEFGECKSWMREDESKCNTNWQNAEWRRYYLDELFGESNAAMPYWYDTRQTLYETTNLHVTKGIKIKPSVVQFFDSLFSDNSKDWIIQMNCTHPPTWVHPSLGLTINELVFEASFSAVDRDEIKPTLHIFTSHPGKMVVETTSEHNSIELSFQKLDSTLFVYFGKVLKYRASIDRNSNKIGAYCSCPEDYYSFNFYEL